MADTVEDLQNARIHNAHALTISARPHCSRYVMAYMESTGAVHKGERVMQIGMGGGMKAGVNVWRALRDIKTVHGAWRHVANAPYTAADMPRSIEDEPGQEGGQQVKTRRGDVVGAVAAMLNGKVSDADLH